MAKRAMWKFQVPVDNKAHEFEVPRGSQAVSCGIGPASRIGHVAVWVAVPVDEAETEKVFLQAVATGEEFEDTLFDSYVGTAMDPERNFVYHVVVMTNEGTD